MKENMYAVFDMGGTNTRLGISQDRESLAKTVIYPSDQDPAVAVGLLEAKIIELTGGQPLTAAAGGIAGVFDPKKETLIKSPHLPKWKGEFSRKALEKQLKVPVKLENDAALGGLGEATHGAGRKKQIVAFLTLGTGIGGVRITNGRIDENVYGFEPGHQILDVSDKFGSWEDFASGTAMENIYKQAAEKITDEKIWDKEALMAAIGIHNAIVFWSPEIVVLGGSVTKSLPLEKVKLYVSSVMKIFPEVPPIVKSELGEMCTLYGALELLKQYHTLEV